MIVVCSLDDLVSVCSSIKPKYLISVIDPGYEPETPRDVKYHLKLGFDDIIEINDENLQLKWDELQNDVIDKAKLAYKWAVDNGIAKEQARVVLPEGNTISRMYVNGTLRSWIHYIQLRTHESTQKEHQDIANEIKGIFIEQFPVTSSALGWK